ncbi:hypothetical protein [Phycicoccus flavus]|uniref:Uncharacterized protein n=1 Tax=Phycicoccus flavus TaxID=2502783 RepID=A0A8T6RA24_9MICO|nr:hypothetical protein [Phycicoccus flavus]NHA69685.1 hypothetical protein [Phycicoccus flavus]
MTERVVEVVGVYNADGGVLGELAYAVGHLTGRTSCGLCDATHRGVRRKPAWDEMTAGLPVPVRLVHRNETTDAERAAAERAGLPVVLGVRGDGSLTTLVPPDRLAAAHGSVDDVGDAIRSALDDEGVA